MSSQHLLKSTGERVLYLGPLHIILESVMRVWMGGGGLVFTIH